MTDNMHPDRLKALRVSMGLTQLKMAEILGINRIKLAHMESGNAKIQGEILKRIEKLAEEHNAK